MNEIITRDFLRNKGLNDFAVFGIMANIHEESRFIPNIAQTSYMKKMNMTSEQYTRMVDDGTYTNFVNDKIGYGICQWTYWSRKENLLNFAKRKNVSIGNLDMQLEFMWNEFQSHKNMMNILWDAASVSEAASVVLMDFERPANAETKKQTRSLVGITLFNQFGSRMEEKKFPYTIKCTHSGVNIYKEPVATPYNICGELPIGTFTITEEKDDPDVGTFGKLKSGAGWIRLIAL